MSQKKEVMSLPHQKKLKIFLYIAKKDMNLNFITDRM